MLNEAIKEYIGNNDNEIYLRDVWVDCISKMFVVGVIAVILYSFIAPFTHIILPPFVKLINVILRG